MEPSDIEVKGPQDILLDLGLAVNRYVLFRKPGLCLFG
jgi:hypothetical protein